MDLGRIGRFGTFTLPFDTSEIGNLFQQDSTDGVRWNLSDVIPTSFDLFDSPEGGGPITGSATANFDGGIVFTPSLGTNSSAQVEYQVNTRASIPTFRNDGEDLTFGFAPTSSVGAIFGKVFTSSIKAELFAYGNVSYDNIKVDVPNPIGSGPADVGSGTIGLGAEDEIRLEIFDSDSILNAPSGSSEQIVVVDSLVDLILSPIEKQDFRARSDISESLLRGIAEGTLAGDAASLFAPSVSQTVRSNVFLDGQLDLDALVQTTIKLAAEGVFTGGIATLVDLVEIVDDGFTDNLEIGLADTILDALGAGGDVLRSIGKHLPVGIDAELVLFDMTKNLGLQLVQDVSFTPEISYTVTYGDLTRTAPIHEDITFTDAELDAFSDTGTPTIEFHFDGTFEATQRIVPVTSIGVTAGQVKFQLKAPTFKFGVLLPTTSIYNYASDELFSESYPQNDAEQEIGTGVVLDHQLRDISYSSGPLTFNYYVVPETVRTPVVIPPGDPLVVRDDNLVVTGTAASEEITVDPFDLFFADDVVIMNGGGGDDILRDGGEVASAQVTQIGGSGDDFIETVQVVDAGEGDDTVEVFGSVNTDADITLGPGDDYVFTAASGGAVVRRVDSGTGNDLVEDISASSLGDPTDVLNANLGIIDLGGGDDTLRGGGADFIILGAGDDLVERGTNGLTQLGLSLDAGAGDDDVQLQAGGNRRSDLSVLGGDGNDVLGVTGDVFDGLVQDERVIEVDGGDGSDVLELTQITGVLLGGADDDVLLGQTFSRLEGGAGNDTLTLSERVHSSFFREDYNSAVSRGSISELFGGEGDDLLQIRLSDASVSLDRAGTLLDGGAGNDRLQDSFLLGNDTASRRDYIVESDDIFIGGSGDDVIAAAAGNDEIQGGEGDDILAKLQGVVALDAGAGNDTILLASNAGLTPLNFPTGSGSTINRGGVVMGSVDGGADTDQLIIDISAMVDPFPVFTETGDTTLKLDYLYKSELDAGVRFVPDSLEVIFYNATDGQIDYMAGDGTILGTLSFRNIESLVFDAAAQVGNERFISETPVHFDFSALDADVVERDFSDLVSWDSFFDPGFGVSGAQGTSHALLVSETLRVLDGSTVVPVNIELRDFLISDTRTTSSPLHPETTALQDFDLVTTNPEGPIDPQDITPKPTPSPTSPTLPDDTLTISVRPRTASVIDPADLPIVDTDTAPDKIYYKVLSAPNLGYLALEGQLLGQNAIFTQQDLLDEKVAFLHVSTADDLTDTLHLQVFDADGQLANTGSVTQGELTFEVVVDTSEAVTGVLTAVEGGIASDGSFETELMLTTAVPVLGSQVVRLAYSGPAASAFEGEIDAIFIDDGQSQASLRIRPEIALALGTGALQIDVVDTSLGVIKDSITTLELPVIEGSDGPTNGNDTIQGTDGDDVLFGGGGNDDLQGGAGNDHIFGDNFEVRYALSEANQVFRLYQATFNRAPDDMGHKRWTSELFTGESTLADVREGFVRSQEFKNTYDGFNDVDFVKQMYINVLDRDFGQGEVTQAEIDNWTGRINDTFTRADLVNGFAESQQLINNTTQAANKLAVESNPANWSDEVYRLYSAALDREPDEGGFNAWMGHLAGGRTLTEVIGGFTNSQEFTNTYGTLADNGDFVKLLYSNVLDRDFAAGEVTQSEVDGWTSQLSDTFTRANIVRGFSESQEFIQNTSADVKAYIRGLGTDDRIDGGTGINVLAGGALADEFTFKQADRATNKVLDLEAWDFLSFDGFGYNTAADALAQITQGAGGAVFADQGTMVTFRGVQFAAITDDMVLV